MNEPAGHVLKEFLNIECLKLIKRASQTSKYKYAYREFKDTMKLPYRHPDTMD